jgi:hypothetical protein
MHQVGSMFRKLVSKLTTTSREPKLESVTKDPDCPNDYSLRSWGPAIFQKDKGIVQRARDAMFIEEAKLFKLRRQLEEQLLSV